MMFYDYALSLVRHPDCSGHISRYFNPNLRIDQKASYIKRFDIALF